MPAILARGDEDGWVDPGLADTDYLQQLLKPFPASQMASYRVTAELNRRDVADSPLLVAPLDGHQPYSPDLA